MTFLTTSTQTDVEKVSAAADLINRYGFLIVFGAVILILGIMLSVMTIKRWDSNNKQKNELETEKTKAEIELMQKQRMKEIEQNSKMFTLVTEVQTSQISQLQAITDVINLMKQEIQQNTRTTSNTSTIVGVLSGDINKMIDNYGGVDLRLTQICEYIKDKKMVDEELVDKVEDLRRLIEDKLSN